MAIGDRVARTPDGPVPGDTLPQQRDEAGPTLPGRPGLPQYKVRGSGGRGAVSGAVESVLRAPGEPMDSNTREFMESRFAHDFSRVRIHADGPGAQAAEALGAEAFTVGQHVAFAAGCYRTATADGRYLLAHELAHTLQQGAAGGSMPRRISVPGEASERSAHAQARAVAQGDVTGGGPTAMAPSTGVWVARKEAEWPPWHQQALNTIAAFAGPSNGKTADETYPQLARYFCALKPSQARSLHRRLDPEAPGGRGGKDAFAHYMQSKYPAHFGDAMDLLEILGDKITPAECSESDKEDKKNRKKKKVDRKQSKPDLHKRLRARLLDGPYKLYTARETYYDEDTKALYLSPAEKNQLVRLRGFYFLLDFDQARLIAPPELRDAAMAFVGDVTPLVPLTRSVFRHFSGTGDPKGYIKTFAKSLFNVSPPSLTTSSKSDKDFAVDRFAPKKTQQGLQKARSTAYATPQAQTLDEADWEGKDLPAQKLKGMDPDQLINQFSVAERAAWYVKKLGGFQAQLYESAAKNHIPMQLLAVVVLNELGDINYLDLLQDGSPPHLNGSLGIGQIQVDTALKHGLVDVNDTEALQAYKRSFQKSSGDSAAARLRKGRRYRTAELLQVPQVAIEAAAREIRYLLTLMGKNLDKPWQKFHGYHTPGPQGAATYRYFAAGVDQRSREATLAYMVIAAYNSPNIIITASGITRIEDLETTFSDGVTHASNGRELAYDLYDAKLFRSM